MTRTQYLLNVLGFWRFRFYRRWVGGRWAEHYIEPTEHLSEYPHWRWELDPAAKFDDATHAIEQWSTALPKAYVRRSEKQVTDAALLLPSGRIGVGRGEKRVAS